MVPSEPEVDLEISAPANAPSSAPASVCPRLFTKIQESASGVRLHSPCCQQSAGTPRVDFLNFRGTGVRESCHLTAPVDARRSTTDVRDGRSEGRDQLVSSDERAIAMLTGVYRDARADDCCIG